MAKTIQLTFFINLTDQARAAELKAQYPNGVSRGPVPASQEFNAPFIPDGDPVTYPCTRTSWMPPGASGKFPLDRAFFTINDGFFGHLFGKDQKYAWIGVFQYIAPPAQPPAPPVPEPQAPGQPAPTLPVGTPPTPNTSTGEPAEGSAAEWKPGPFLKIAFAEGFENYIGIGGNDGAEGGANMSSTFTRDASRMVDGYGFAVRSSAASCDRNWATFSTQPSTAWERFYFRLRQFSTTGDVTIWRVRMGSAGLANAGFILQVNGSGAVVMRSMNENGLAGSTVNGTSAPLELNRWYCLDMTYDSVVTNPSGSTHQLVGTCHLYIDHALVISSTSVVFGVLGFPMPAPAATVSTVGVAIGTNASMNCDFDDWLGFVRPASSVPGANELWSNSPAAGIARTNPGSDWTHGHHIAAVYPHGFDVGNTGWTGDFRGLTQHSQGTNDEDILTSSVSGALASLLTKADQHATRDGSLGIQGFQINVLMSQSVAGVGKLGYEAIRLNDAGEEITISALTDIVHSASAEWHNVPYFPDAEMTPITLKKLGLRFSKAANTNPAAIRAMFATVVLIGTFDTCDGWPESRPGDPAGTPPKVSQLGIHNAQYPFSPWVRTVVQPDSPVWVAGGLYTGNNLGQDIIAKIPAHWFWVRPLGGAGGGVKWWSSMAAPHWSSNSLQRGGLNGAMQDPNYVSSGADASSEIQALLRIGGTSVSANANAQSFQWIAIGDPGQRFMINGSFLSPASAASAGNILRDATFTPEWALFAWENPQSGFANSFYVKGPANTINGGSPFDSAESTTVATFAPGSITSLLSLHPAGGGLSDVAYNAWRQRDGADYAALEIPEPVVWQLVTWTGDGSASRTIALPRVSGKRPLWAIANGANTQSFVRDPSHLTTTSTQASAGNVTVTTAITGGGVDQISVASGLNGNGVNFQAFVLMAPTDTPGNNGWGVNGEKLYDPVPAPGSQWEKGYTQKQLDDLENPTAPSGGYDDGEDLADDLADPLCVPFVLRAVNLAFVRLGISDLVATKEQLLTPTTRETTLAAQFYEHCLRATLRDFPWPHATRYANLTWIAGSEQAPVNGDWIYSFRAPAGIIMGRRIVPGTLGGRRYSGTPIPFRQAEDAGGPLVYTNTIRWVPAPVVTPPPPVPAPITLVPSIELEYTIRPHCGSKAAGDQLFVSTFAHRLAAEIGGPLARDPALIERSATSYELQRNIASTETMRESQQEKPGDAPWIEGR